MFTDILLNNNPQLIDFGVYLHKKGIIQPDTYLLDCGRILSNYQLIQNKASSLGMECLVMTKQVGRHPILIKKLASLGAKFVAVDFREALGIAQLGGKLAHLGHLVQIPWGLIPKVLAYRPEYITVYSLQQAECIQKYAQTEGFIQNILIRPLAEPYEGQNSECYTDEAFLEFACQLAKMPNLKLCGLTSFPCFLFDEASHKITATQNAEILLRQFTLLNEDGFGLTVKNMPSHNCYAALDYIKSFGATHIEPGHALTGTCPYHSAYPSASGEQIALAYLSEVSHHAEGRSYIYGGGYYRRSHWEKAYIPSLKSCLKVQPFNAEAIDYTLALDGIAPIGSAVVSAFRTQIFVTRSHSALIGGLEAGQPKLLGIADAHGTLISKD